MARQTGQSLGLEMNHDDIIGVLKIWIDPYAPSIFFSLKTYFVKLKLEMI